MAEASVIVLLQASCKSIWKKIKNIQGPYESYSVLKTEMISKDRVIDLHYFMRLCIMLVPLETGTITDHLGIKQISFSGK